MKHEKQPSQIVRQSHEPSDRQVGSLPQYESLLNPAIKEALGPAAFLVFIGMLFYLLFVVFPFILALGMLMMLQGAGL